VELESQLIIKEQQLERILVSTEEEIKKEKKTQADKFLEEEKAIQKEMDELVDKWEEKQKGNEKIISELSEDNERLKRRLRDRGLSTASNSTNSSSINLNTTLNNEMDWRDYNLSNDIHSRTNSYDETFYSRSSSPTKSNFESTSSPLGENFSGVFRGRQRFSSSLSNANGFQSRDLKIELAGTKRELTEAKKKIAQLEKENSEKKKNWKKTPSFS